MNLVAVISVELTVGVTVVLSVELTVGVVVVLSVELTVGELVVLSVELTVGVVVVLSVELTVGELVVLSYHIPAADTFSIFSAVFVIFNNLLYTTHRTMTSFSFIVSGLGGPATQLKSTLQSEVRFVPGLGPSIVVNTVEALISSTETKL